MFGLVDPDEICPVSIAEEVQPAQQQQQQQLWQEQKLQPQYLLQPQEQPLQLQIQQQLQIEQPQAQPLLQQQAMQQIQTVSLTHQIQHIQPPPKLKLYDEPKVHLAQRIKDLSRQRPERVQARMERAPAQDSSAIRRATGKKLTGRERQIELEKQETHQLELKNRYLEMINELESKCARLREILESIVATSPEYNEQMINFLETSNLLYDQNENSLSFD